MAGRKENITLLLGENEARHKFSKNPYAAAALGGGIVPPHEGDGVVRRGVVAGAARARGGGILIHTAHVTRERGIHVHSGIHDAVGHDGRLDGGGIKAGDAVPAREDGLGRGRGARGAGLGIGVRVRECGLVAHPFDGEGMEFLVVVVRAAAPTEMA